MTSILFPEYHESLAAFSWERRNLLDMRFNLAAITALIGYTQLSDSNRGV